MASMDLGLSAHAEQVHEQVRQMIVEEIEPLDAEFLEEVPTGSR